MESAHLCSVEDDEAGGVGGPGQLRPPVPRHQRLPQLGPAPGPGGELPMINEGPINTVQAWTKF